MRKVFSLMFPVLLLTVLSVGLVFPVLATKGSYPGGNGKIAFRGQDLDGENMRIFVMNNDGSNIQQITDETGFTDYEPCWSPDGTKIVFQRRSVSGGGGEIWTMNADGTGQKQLTTGATDFNPAWSPDGKKIAFARAGFMTTDIFVINADGTGSANLLINNGVHPSWSPDGTKIVYMDIIVPTSINVADATTGSVISQLITNGYDACWSPDGSKIVFVRMEAIWVMNSDGSNEKKLTTPPTGNDIEDGGPNWSPDGNKIIFDRTFDSIMIMNADGTNVYDLTSDMDYDREPDYQSLPLAPVGGVAIPMNKLAVLTPYISLAGLIIAVSAVYFMRRHKD